MNTLLSKTLSTRARQIRARSTRARPIKIMPKPLTLTAISILSLSTVISPVQAAHQQENPPNPILQEADRNAENRTSPARRIDRQSKYPREEANTNPSYRTFNGMGNNRQNPQYGAAHIQLKRQVPSAYADGVFTLANNGDTSARTISNIMNAQNGLIPNVNNASDFLWQWGQFVDHDIDLTDGADPTESADIKVPAGDSFFDPQNTGTVTISFNRSLYDTTTGTSTANPRQQINEITAWIDASNVYGSDIDRANALRNLDGTGRLRLSAGNLLPFNTDGLANAGGNSAALFVAGDVRANEQLGLTTMHTLFMREHNRLADLIREQHPDLSGEDIYQKARKIVGAQMQIITYREYLPVLLGRDALRPYRGYRSNVNPNINHIFSTASYRYGHSALSPTLLRLKADGSESEYGNLSLRDAFFSPQRLSDEGGIEPVLRGLAGQLCQATDPFVIDDVRNFLFGAPGSGGFDLVALNIQRGRDHGLPSYNEVRVAMGLAKATSVADISSSAEIQTRLSRAYPSLDDIDLWVGGLAEDAVNGGMMGELISAILIQQFEALRDGDRFWYENSLNDEELQLLGRTTLAEIIRRNTTIDNEISNNVFRVTQRPRPQRRRR